MSFLDLYQGDQDQAARMQPNEGTRLPSGFDENFHAAWSDGLLFSQSIARENAKAAVLNDYVSEIRQKTGNDISQELDPDVQPGTIGPSMFDQANARVAKIKESYPDLDLNPLSSDEIEKRAVEKSQASHRAYETLQSGERTWGGWFGSQMGSLSAGALDPINVVGLGIAPEAAGIGILSTALRWGALAGVSQAAIEAASDTFKEQVQPGYMESGQPLKEIAGAFVGGAVVGGGTKALGNAWTRVKTGQWPTSVRDAGNVIESHANVADTNPFPGAEGEVAHHEALVKTIDDILAGRPIDVSTQITPELQAQAEIRRKADNAVELSTVFHGTGRNFDEFSTSFSGHQTSAVFFSDSAEDAAKFGAGKNLIEAKLNLNDPLRIDAGGELFNTEKMDDALRTAKEEGHDGLIVSNIRNFKESNPTTTYAAFDPSRIQITQKNGKPLPAKQLDLPLQDATAEPAAEGQSLRGRERSRRREDEAPQPLLQTADEMTKTLTAPDHHDAIRADIDRERALGDVQVPGIDEQGNHTMVSVDKAMDEVDAYKAAAEQIQACANPAVEEEAA